VVFWSLEGRAVAPLKVFVSVLPLETFVERLGGERVAVEVMVPPGHSPATYEPTPRQMADLADAELYVRVGVPFERAWMDRIEAINPAMVVLDARDGIALRLHAGHEHEIGAHDPGQATEEAELDPHVWTSPRLVAPMAAGIRDALIRLDPMHRDLFEDNYRGLVADLSALDRDLQKLLQPLEHRRFMVFHPAWGYFAEAYGLEQVAIERAGKEPGAKALAALIGQARREGVKVIFVQPQFNRRAAEQVARAIGGRVETIDPLAPDYFANLRRAAALIAGADRP
jgi:zinc transport system substrate-binding protein